MRGKTLDMASLGKAHQDVIAVTGGGMNMNARGDILGPGGKIVKKIEQIQEEYNNANPSGRQKISMADSNKMKKFALKRQFLTPEEVQNQVAKMEREKLKAKKNAEKLIKTTEFMAETGPVISDHTLSDKDDLIIEDTEKSSKPKRTIIDSEE